MVTGVTRGYKHVSVGALFIIKQLSYPILSKALQRGVQEVTRGCKGLQRVTNETGGYRGLQGVTGRDKGDTGLEGVTKD